MCDVLQIPSNLGLDNLDEILPVLVDQGLPCDGEFLCADLNGDARTTALIALLIWHGFLPMGGTFSGTGYLLPKIHLSRCILPPQQIHVGRKARRRARGFRLTVDADWPAVVRHVQQYTWTTHEGDCWLTDQLANAYQAVSRENSEWRRGDAAFHSVELWDAETHVLVAGEIGYTCGSIYSSCTGFTLKDRYPGSGTVQLAALGRWLARCGFSLWDLGMELPYKVELGGHSVSRAEWMRQVRIQRTVRTVLAAPQGADADAHTLICADDA